MKPNQDRYINPDKAHNDLFNLTPIQRKAVRKPCPDCEVGDLHAVVGDSNEIMLWCNFCDLSMDSDGGIIN